MISFSYICAHCCDICVDSPLLWPGILLLCCLIVLSIVLQMASVTCDYETFAVSYLCLYKKMIYFYLLSHQEFLLDNYLNMRHLLIKHSFMTLQKKNLEFETNKCLQCVINCLFSHRRKTSYKRAVDQRYDTQQAEDGGLSPLRKKTPSPPCPASKVRSL